MNTQERLEPTLRRLSYWSFIIIIAISALSLLGWVFSLTILTSIKQHYIPIAPSTALCFLIVSVSFLTYLFIPNTFFRTIAACCSSLTILIASILLISFFMGIIIETEQLGLVQPLSQNLSHRGHMSPVTAGMFIVASLGILLLCLSTGKKQLYKNAASFMGLSVSITGFIMILGYLHGTPLLYRANFVPVSLLASVAFVFLGVGIVFFSGASVPAIRIFVGPSMRSHLTRAFFPVAIASVLIDDILNTISLFFTINAALISFLAAILSATIIGIVIAKMAKSIGGEIDQANEERDEKVAALRENEELFRSYLENAPDGVYLSDLEGNFIYGNLKCEAIIGYQRDELIGKNFLELNILPEKSLNKAAQLLQANIEGKSTGPDEFELISKEGRIIPVEISTSVVQRMDQAIALSFVRDVTDRKLAEDKLRESERFAFSTMDALAAHIAVLDENDTIIAVNKAWRDFAASNPPIHQNVCEGAKYLAVCGIAEGEDQPKAFAFAQGIMAVMTGKEKEFSLEYPCHSPSEQRWFVGRVTRFSGPGPIRIVVSHENITERKLAEEDLRLYREHLEELVEQRTLELQERNAELVKGIAERKRAEKTIRESEDRYRILVELTPDIIYRLNEDGTIRFISSAIGQLGYNPEKLIGIPFEEIVYPDDRQQVHDILLERRIGERRIKNIEVRLLNKKQKSKDYALSYTFIELSARGYWDVSDSEITRPDKHFLYTQGVAHDITMRKRAEEVLKESAIRTHLLKDVASAANAAATPDDALQVAIEGIARYIGWPVGHVYIADEKNPEVLIPTDIWYLEDENRFRLFRESTATTIITSGVGMIGRVLASKKTLWIEDVTAYPDFLRTKLADHIGVHGAFGFPVIVGGRVTAVLEFFSPKEEKSNPSLMDLMDEIGIQLGIVIERKQAEEELKKLSQAVEQSPATVVITDVKGKIQYVNPKFAELTGYSSAEAIGKNPRILSSGNRPKSFYKELWETILSGQNWYGTFCNRKKNSEIYWERASISPVRNEHGEITNFVAVKEDITKLLQYEDELKQAKEIAEDANRAKSDFLASMSHELRTPLNAIIGFSEVLKEQFFGPLIQKQEEYVEDILESGKHLLSLINDILDLSKVEAGKMELELSRVNVSDLINNSLIMIREKSMKHNITLSNDVRQEVENLEIMADARKLKQVLFNLLSNAVKFTFDGGAISLVAKLAHDSQPTAHDKKSDFLEISVEDTGMGIIPEHQEKIFEPFYQVKGSKQDKTPGTGLGLPLSKDLVELHGGTIWVESEGKGTGSKISFKIPIERGEKLEKAID